MEQKSVSSYVMLGATEKYLEDIQKDHPVHGEGHFLDNLSRFIDLLDELDFPVTTGAIKYVRLDTIKDDLKATDDDAKLSAERVKNIRREMRHIRVALISESQQKLAFIVTPKRIEVDRLLDDPGSLMAPGIWDELEDLVRYDLSEAAKCIAFERPTAAAFHLMRATEGALRGMYCTVVKRKRVDPLLWSPMIEQLRGRSKPPPRPLLDQLDNIRHNFRNPTQHPDAVYDIQEAQDLWSLAIDAITRMTRMTTDVT
jgi:hypothetical protein